MYLLLVLAMSALFDKAAEGALRAQVDEDVVATLRSAGDLDASAYEKLRVETVKARRTQYRLDENWALRSLGRATDALRFRFGRSSSLKSASGSREVLDLVGEALPNTLLLFGSEAMTVFALGIALGLAAARRQGGALDRSLSLIAPILGGLPLWWLAMLALAGLSYGLGIFPSGGIRSNPAPTGLGGFLDRAWHLSLPLLLLTVVNSWGVALQARALAANAFESQWIMSARARGLSERRVVYAHVLPSIGPAIAAIAITGLLQSLSGNLLVEGIFGWPGIGNLYFTAVQQGDVPVLVGVLSMQAAINLAGFLALDIAMVALDPRLKKEGA